jgi:hypothetical protein
VVTGSADIAIIARGLVEQMEAPGLGIAGIIGTGILVVAGQQARREALCVTAVVTQGTSVAVVALPRHGLMETPPCGRTTIGSTLVTVVAHQRVASHTGPINTTITDGTGISILAASRIGSMHTTALGVAGIIRADIVIGTVQSNATGAQAILTGITNSAWIGILAGLATICGHQGTGPGHRVA